jgi:hypothetical protein
MWGKVRKKPAPFAFDRVIGYGTLFLVGALLGMLLVPEQEAFATGNVTIRVAGQKVDSEQEAQTAASALANAYLAEPFTVTAADEQLELPRSALGARVDSARLASLLEQARDPRSALRRIRRQIGAGDLLNLPMPVDLDTRLTIPAIVRLKDTVEHPGRSSSPAEKREAGRPRQTAILDLHGTVEAIERAMLAGERSARARLVRLPRGRNDTRAADIDVSEAVGFFETRFEPDRMSRKHLLRLRSAVEAIDGYVLGAQEVFDFNRIVNRSQEVDDGTSGGGKEGDTVAGAESPDPRTCQAASTLHGAALFAGLPILERHPHAHTPEHVKLGLDAVAGRGGPNLRFRNDLRFSLVITMSLEGGSVRAELRGARRMRTVTLERTIVSALPFRKRFLEDPLLAEGVRVLSRRGVPGFIVKCVRTVKPGPENRESKERTRDVYRPVTEIWHTGTAPLDTPVETLPENDTRAEFLEDEYLLATQGPGIRGFEVRRKPGITGAHGWTSRGQFLGN